jgi:serine/threonine-protein kinase RsbW
VPDIRDRSRFVRSRVAADPRSAARTRAEFASWLKTHFTLGAQRFNDLLVAVYEAIANAAEFAYVDDPPLRGTVDVSAAYDVDSDTLAVAVDDHGHWRESFPAPAAVPPRGRGLHLMRVLADKVAIDRTPHGTHVTLTWTDLTR